MGTTSSTTTGELVPTPTIYADGHTAEEAAEKLMQKMTASGIKYSFCYNTVLLLNQTLPTLYETNIVASGTLQRASVERMVSPSTVVYWRARFGGLLCA